MKRRGHSIQRGILGLVFCSWLMAGAAGAASRGESNAWDGAMRYFTEGYWDQAQSKLAAFTNSYPGSDNFAEAVLRQAQARYHLAEKKASNEAAKRPWNFSDVVELLNGQLNRAGDLADRYLYWMAEAYYADAKYVDAANTYARLARDYDTMRAEAQFLEADCYFQTKDWARVEEKLRAPDGAFQQMTRTNAGSEWVAKGLFLLTEAERIQGDSARAAEAVQEIPPQKPGSELEWKRQLLLAQVKLEGGHADEALQGSTNLLAAAAGKAPWTTASQMLLGEINWRLGQLPEAMSNYEAILSADTNVESQREALTNIIDLNLRLGHTAEATRRLAKFVADYPEEYRSDFDLLTLGKLQLRQRFESADAGAPSEGGSNYLGMAETNFQTILRDTNSVLRGEAELYLGWCLYTEGEVGRSGIAFSNAVQLLTNGEDKAEALFKLADTQYEQTNYTGAISNYTRVVEDYGSFAVVTNSLFERALYQIVRASTEEAPPDLATASNAVGRILAWFPNRFLGEPSLLLLGLATDRAGRPAARGARAAEARRVFAGFTDHWPDSKLRPEVDLAVARTYEREGDWTNAIAKYTAWIDANPTNASLPIAEFSLAWANSQAGNETNALEGFTSYVGKYTNELAAQAQYLDREI